MPVFEWQTNTADYRPGSFAGVRCSNTARRLCVRLALRSSGQPFLIWSCWLRLVTGTAVSRNRSESMSTREGLIVASSPEKSRIKPRSDAERRFHAVPARPMTALEMIVGMLRAPSFSCVGSPRFCTQPSPQRSSRFRVKRNRGGGRLLLRGT
jgi:hypothetical protein